MITYRESLQGKDFHNQVLEKVDTRLVSSILCK